MQIHFLTEIKVSDISGQRFFSVTVCLRIDFLTVNLKGEGQKTIAQIL